MPIGDQCRNWRKVIATCGSVFGGATSGAPHSMDVAQSQVDWHGKAIALYFVGKML